MSRHHHSTILVVLVLIGIAAVRAFSFSSTSHSLFRTNNNQRQQQQSLSLSNSQRRAKATIQEEEQQTTTTTIQDDQVKDPASLVFYDNVLDDTLPEGVVCARGVCVLAEDDFDEAEKEEMSLVNRVLNSYLGPRILLAIASILYGTNFPLGAIMNEALPPSAATSARMVLASLALSPFLLKLDPKLAKSAIVCGCFTALGYTTQSLALIDTSPATVAFLGAATVIVCPTLEALVNKKPMSLQDAPQVWLAACLCLLGVGILELYTPSSSLVDVGTAAGLFNNVGWGDLLSILQAIGFGTSFFLTERMMRGKPDQALPITAVQVFTTSFICMIWCLSDNWIGSSTTANYALPNLFFSSDHTLQIAAVAVVWTGFITTALNRFVETSSLGKVSSAEASVILATEPLWAALFAALILHDQFGINDYVGGSLIVLACLANTLQPSNFSFLFTTNKEEKVDNFRP